MNDYEEEAARLDKLTPEEFKAEWERDWAAFVRIAPTPEQVMAIIERALGPKEGKQ